MLWIHSWFKLWTHWFQHIISLPIKRRSREDITVLRRENAALIARFMGPTWGPSGADRTQLGPMLAPWTLLSGRVLTAIHVFSSFSCDLAKYRGRSRMKINTHGDPKCDDSWCFHTVNKNPFVYVFPNSRCLSTLNIPATGHELNWIELSIKNTMRKLKCGMVYYMVTLPILRNRVLDHGPLWHH